MDPIDPLEGNQAQVWDQKIENLSPPKITWPPSGHIVLISPHPDDELLAAGATLATASDKKTPITILGVTNGELSHPYLNESERQELGKRREHETISAYQTAGIQAERIALSAPDGFVSQHIKEIQKQLEQIIQKDTICITPWEGDGHPDHQACALAAKEICSKNKVPLFASPIWLWNWDNPKDPTFPFSEAFSFRFDADIMRRKQEGINCYTSQIQSEDGYRPVLPTTFLEHFERQVEVFLPVI
jgi:LmbE family N-acetylglucosaminyl deacetylase